MGLKNMFLRSTRVIVSWEENFGKIQLVYNDFAAPYKTVVEHWPPFMDLAPFFKNTNSPYAVLQPSDFVRALKVLDRLKKLYESNEKMCFIYEDSAQKLDVCNEPPAEFIVKYVVEGSNLKRIVPNGTIEFDDGWYCWNNHLWKPDLKNEELKKFREVIIDKKDIVKFLNNDMPRFLKTGMLIQCEVTLTDQKAISISIDNIERDKVDFDVIWNVPLDSINLDFKNFGYIISDNKIMRGIDPVEVETVFENIVGVHTLKGETIPAFLLDTYPRWKEWITGDTAKLLDDNKIIEPPYDAFLMVSNESKKGIGKGIATPYIVIGNECLSGKMINEALQHKYTHIKNGWIRKEDLVKHLDKQIVNDPGEMMKPFVLMPNQIIHQGDKRLSALWDGIEMIDNTWVDNAPKYKMAEHHLDYLMHWGIEGGIIGGFEAFAAYGLSYVINYSLKNAAKVLIIISEECQETFEKLTTLFSDDVVENTSVTTYQKWNKNGSGVKERFDLVVMVEPDAEIAAGNKSDSLVGEKVYDLLDKAGMSISFLANTMFNIINTQKEWYKSLLLLDDANDLAYLVRDINTPMSLPPKHAFKKSIFQDKEKLIFHKDALCLEDEASESPQ